eukprot:6477281-Amphidinium_carterae.1
MLSFDSLSADRQIILAENAELEKLTILHPIVFPATVLNIRDKMSIDSCFSLHDLWFSCLHIECTRSQAPLVSTQDVTTRNQAASFMEKCRRKNVLKKSAWAKIAIVGSRLLATNLAHRKNKSTISNTCFLVKSLPVCFISAMQMHYRANASTRFSKSAFDSRWPDSTNNRRLSATVAAA